MPGSGRGEPLKRPHHRMAALVTTGSVWLKVAAMSGASAVALGAYGAHGLHPKDPYFATTFDRGNKYHLMHSLLLAAAPLSGCARSQAFQTCHLLYVTTAGLLPRRAFLVWHMQGGSNIHIDKEHALLHAFSVSC